MCKWQHPQQEIFSLHLTFTPPQDEVSEDAAQEEIILFYHK